MRSIEMSKELSAPLEWLLSARGKNNGHEVLKYVYRDKENLVATDTCRIHVLSFEEKYLDHLGLKDGSLYSARILSAGRITLLERTTNLTFPQYRSVIPDPLDEKNKMRSGDFVLDHEESNNLLGCFSEILKKSDQEIRLGDIFFADLLGVNHLVSPSNPSHKWKFFVGRPNRFVKFVGKFKSITLTGVLAPLYKAPQKPTKLNT